MSLAKIYIGQIVVVLAIVVTSTWGATQWAAHALGYQEGLGSPWLALAGYPLYLPWRLFEWWFAYDAYAPGIFERAGAISAGGGVAGALFAVVNSVWRARQNQLVTTYGSARWAPPKEIANAGLFRPNGVFLSRFDDNYLRHDGPEHVMCFAPTRSGKGVGLVLPTLLSWTSSAVVHDIKGENWHLTAGWRSRFSHCLLFDPTDVRSARYNPLLEVRKGAAEVRDVQNIADILVDPGGALERRTHWEKTSHTLLVGVILHVLYAEEQKTLTRVTEILADPAQSFEKTLRIMMATNHLGTLEAQRFIRLSPQPRGSCSTNLKTNAPASCRPRSAFSGSTAIRRSAATPRLATGALPIWLRPPNRSRFTSWCRLPTLVEPSRLSD
jgi:type IV secretion system protein VirD4